MTTEPYRGGVTRSGAIAALTVVGVLAATGTAAALNARILDPSPFRSVGTVDPLVPSEIPSGAQTPSDLGSPSGVGLTPAPDDPTSSATSGSGESGDDGGTESPVAASSADRTTARPASSRTTSRPSSARPSSSSPRPSHSESESEHEGDGHHSSPEPSSSEPHDD